MLCKVVNSCIIDYNICADFLKGRSGIFKNSFSRVSYQFLKTNPRLFFLVSKLRIVFNVVSYIR